MSHTNQDIDIKNYLVEVKEGYYRPIVCTEATCSYKTLTVPDMLVHVASIHKHSSNDSVNDDLISAVKAVALEETSLMDIADAKEEVMAVQTMDLMDDPNFFS